MVGRAFASARPVNAGHAAGVLTPACLQLIGREMVRTGEALHVVQVGRDGLELIPVHVWDVRGDVAPSSWVYRLDLAGPTRQQSRTVAEADVVSCKWATDPARPWAGVDPLTFAHLSGQLHAKVVEALRDEAGGPRGHLVPIPKNPDATIDSLSKTIAGLRGAVALVESQHDAWGTASDGKRSGWDPKRIGAAPSGPLVDLHAAATRVALACSGIPPELADAGVDATSRREAFRQFLHLTLRPLGEMVAGELRTKLDLPANFRLDWTGLGAADTQGRARAFGALTGGGLEIERALTLTGFTEAA